MYTHTSPLLEGVVHTTITCIHVGVQQKAMDYSSVRFAQHIICFYDSHVFLISREWT
jgi:hypothetical protein